MTTDLSRAVWAKSSYSGGNGGQCVEVAANLDGIVAVRAPRTRTGRSWSSRPASGRHSPLQCAAGNLT
jgi:hypothetical protein